MTHPPSGPSNPPPPGGPGRDFIDDDYELQLASVGCEVTDALAEATAAAAPALTDEQHKVLNRIFAGGSW